MLRPMTGIIEGFEGSICMIEIDGRMQDIPRSTVDPSAKAGDIVEWDGEKWIPNQQQTEKRSKKIKDLMDQLWEDE